MNPPLKLKELRDGQKPPMPARAQTTQPIRFRKAAPDTLMPGLAFRLTPDGSSAPLLVAQAITGAPVSAPPIIDRCWDVIQMMGFELVEVAHPSRFYRWHSRVRRKRRKRAREKTCAPWTRSWRSLQTRAGAIAWVLLLSKDATEAPCPCKRIVDAIMPEPGLEITHYSVLSSRDA